MITSSQQFSCSTVTVNCTVKKEKCGSVNYLPPLFGLLANKKVYFNERDGEYALSGVRVTHTLPTRHPGLGHLHVWLCCPQWHNHNCYCFKGHEQAWGPVAPRGHVTRPARLSTRTRYGADIIICSHGGGPAAYRSQSSRQSSIHNSLAWGRMDAIGII